MSLRGDLPLLGLEAVAAVVVGSRSFVEDLAEVLDDAVGDAAQDDGDDQQLEVVHL